MADTVADIVNQSLDAIGADMEISDIEEGSRHAKVALRAYLECLKQLLRAANWDFAKARGPLTLLADATGQTADVGSVVPEPWIYEYAYPDDCVKARVVPSCGLQLSPVPSGNIAIPATPLMPGLNGRVQGARQRPAPFAISTDDNYPPATQVGAQPASRKVILCNVPQAELVYIRLMLQPATWDPLFRGAFVSYLAQEIAMGVLPDKKMARQMRSDQIAITRQKIVEARVADGNEVPRSSDITVDWMRARAGGGGSFPTFGAAASGYNSDLWRGEFAGAGSGGGAVIGDFGSDFSPLDFADGTSA